MSRRKPYVFDVTECIELYSLLLSIVKAYEQKYGGLTPGLVKVRKKAERFIAEAEEHLSNWTGT